MNQRETLSSRLGFLLLSAGCAIGLGNIWRFPFIVGKYGGGAFVMLYLLFLILLGFPVMVMELSIGRGSRRNLADGYGILAQRHGGIWRRFGLFFFAGNLVLLMFYSTVAGWMPAYAWHTLTGNLHGLEANEVGGFFGEFIQSPMQMTGWMLGTLALAAVICAAGLRRGVERVVKWMMAALFLMMLVLCVHSLRLPKAMEGVDFYLMPSWERMRDAGLLEVVMAAMGQAFFTLSLGIGSMAIFGSYASKDKSLGGESCGIVALDTIVALLAGVVIFPACAAFGVSCDAGPSLVFITLPNIFNQMAGGRFWGTVFFIFMSLAALTTVIAVLENLVAFIMERFGRSRPAASLLGGALVGVLSLPCALGFNVLADIQPLGKGSSILDLEDFIVSDNLLPLGSLCMVLFCTWRWGWGWPNFLAEANTGDGLKMPGWLKNYARWVIAPVIVVIFVAGYYARFFAR